MARHHVLSFVSASLLATTAFVGAASAQEPLPVADKTVGAVDTSAEPKHYAVILNPLATAVGRYSVDALWMPAVHHALVINPFFQRLTADVTSTATVGNATMSTSYTDTFSGFGGELGYRFYSGDHGPSGFYIGPSLIAGAYSESSSLGGDKVSFTSYGAALDIGGQAMLKSGILIGGGFGLQYTKSSKDFSTGDLPLKAQILAGGGVHPRFLFSFGYAWG